MCNFLDKLCPCCERYSATVESRRRNTSYDDDRLNNLYSCQECYDKDYEHYADLWKDYYSSR